MSSAEKILVTGGAGFIGSRLVAKLAQEGHEVVVLDSLLPQVHGDDPQVTSPSYRVALENARVLRADVRDRDALARALAGVSVVYHLAAETGTGQSMYEIRRYVDANVSGTAALLDGLRESGGETRRIILASSRSIYGEGKYRDVNGALVYPGPRRETDMVAGKFEVLSPETGEPLEVMPTDEDSEVHPSSVYGVTKQVQEQLVRTVAPTQGADAVVLRFQNVYGPGQSLSNPYTGILSIFTGRILAGLGINVFEDGLESRDFVFVDDVVNALWLAMTSPQAGGHTINVGAGVPTSVLEVVHELQQAYGRNVEVQITGDFRLGDIRHNFAALDRASDILGYRPAVSFKEGIRSFAGWAQGSSVASGSYERSLDEMRAHSLLKRGAKR